MTTKTKLRIRTAVETEDGAVVCESKRNVGAGATPTDVICAIADTATVARLLYSRQHSTGSPPVTPRVADQKAAMVEAMDARPTLEEVFAREENDGPFDKAFAGAMNPQADDPPAFEPGDTGGAPAIAESLIAEIRMDARASAIMDSGGATFRMSERTFWAFCGEVKKHTGDLPPLANGLATYRGVPVLISANVPEGQVRLVGDGGVCVVANLGGEP